MFYYLDLITPAQYWHNPLNHQEFLNGSHYLADINNERLEKTEEYKENLLMVENFVLAKWLQDQTIIPGASAQFGFYLDGQVRYRTEPCVDDPHHVAAGHPHPGPPVPLPLH